MLRRYVRLVRQSCATVSSQIQRKVSGINKSCALDLGVGGEAMPAEPHEQTLGALGAPSGTSQGSVDTAALLDSKREYNMEHPASSRSRIGRCCEKPSL